MVKYTHVGYTKNRRVGGVPFFFTVYTLSGYARAVVSPDRGWCIAFVHYLQQKCGYTTTCKVAGVRWCTTKCTLLGYTNQGVRFCSFLWVGLAAKHFAIIFYVCACDGGVRPFEGLWYDFIEYGGEHTDLERCEGNRKEDEVVGVKEGLGHCAAEVEATKGAPAGGRKDPQEHGHSDPYEYILAGTQLLEV